MRVAILCLVCFQIGCSGPGVKVETGKSKVVSGKDACSLLTLGDAQEVYGADMQPSDRNRAASGPGADVSTCTYQNDRTPMSIVTLTAVWARTEANPFSDRDAYLAQLAAQMPDLAGEKEMQKIDFQGLPAIWQVSLRQMIIFKNGAMVTLNADAAPGKDKRQTTEVLMARIAGRL